MNNANLLEKWGLLWLWKSNNLLQQWKKIHGGLRLKIKDIIKKTEKKWIEKGTQYYKEKHLREKKVIILYF